MVDFFVLVRRSVITYFNILWLLTGGLWLAACVVLVTVTRDTFPSPCRGAARLLWSVWRDRVGEREDGPQHRQVARLRLPRLLQH